MKAGVGGLAKDAIATRTYPRFLSQLPLLFADAGGENAAGTSMPKGWEPQCLSKYYSVR